MPAGEQSLARTSGIEALLVLLPDPACLLLALLQVGLDRGTMAQIVTERRIDVR